MPDLIIFDCDGTLVDSEATCNQALVGVLREFGVNLDPERAFGLFLGQTTGDVVRYVQAETGRDPVGFAGALEAAEIAAIRRGIQPIPGAPELLQQLSLPKCVATNGARDKALCSLTVTGLLDHFGERVFSSQQVAAGKPAPDLFLHAANACGVRPEACWVVEDSPHGLTAGRAANMRTFGLIGHLSASEIESHGAQPLASLLDLLAEL